MASILSTGLTEKDIDEIRRIARSVLGIRSVTLFGSRAKGNYKPGSDVDLVIECDMAGYTKSIELEYLLNEESSMPYFFDVIDGSSISEPALKEHIKRVGVKLLV